MDISNIGLILIFALAVATLWLGVNRWRIRLESNWPLIYYGLLVAVSNYYPDLLFAPILYVAVVCGLLLRFEFLNALLVSVVRVVEMLCFAAIGWWLFAELLKYF